MTARGERRVRRGKYFLTGALLLSVAGVSYAEPGPAQPLLGEAAPERHQLPDFRSDLIHMPRYQNPATARAVKVSSPAASESGVRLGYDRLLDEQQLRTPPPIHERMRANMRDPQPATVLKLHLR